MLWDFGNFSNHTSLNHYVNIPWWLTEVIETRDWLQVHFHFTQILNIKALDLQNQKFFIWSRNYFIDPVDQVFMRSLLIDPIDQFFICSLL